MKIASLSCICYTSISSYWRIKSLKGESIMLTMHVFLVGMAGGGKTSLGKKLASNLKLPYVDTDVKVSEMMGMSEKEIYKNLGEAFFRSAETGVLMSLASEPPSIVSTGGGLPTIKENVMLMQNQGIIVHIDRPLDQILSDIKTDRRPHLENAGIDDVIDLYNRTIGYYKACADYTLDNSFGFALGAANLTRLVKSLY